MIKKTVEIPVIRRFIEVHDMWGTREIRYVGLALSIAAVTGHTRGEIWRWSW